ncbi:MAG TPA: nucleotide sugar dehydrogenase [Candidatus Nanoarchaeia archaeon]|nr:nucleotide sugar dehydrogenase [Candidatus Nanoarchaeia archaeon]
MGVLNISNVRICVVGLGYVGLPLAVEFSRHFPVTGFDVASEKISLLQQHRDPAEELSAEILRGASVTYTADPAVLRKVNFIIVAVPTPIDQNKDPDLGPVEHASHLIGKHLQKDTVVVYESTVYPGVTEDICVPILEQESGLVCGTDFKVGYSPERINPGDKDHTLTTVTKIVSGMDFESLDLIAKVYSTIVQAGVYRSPSIKVAEAAKVIENTQRDLNIALMNELALIFGRMGISTIEVINAAATKWNFHKYIPGLVGGHCISIDPHYLLYKAQQLGYHPKVILAGRDVNDYMPRYVAELAVKAIAQAGKPVRGSTVLVMGLTFKENVTDTRNSKIKHTIRELQEHGIAVFGCDPLLDPVAAGKKFNVPMVSLNAAQTVDCIIYARRHAAFDRISLEQLKQKMNPPHILIDLTYRFDATEAQRQGVLCKQL